ncbi:MAG: hypothetical protein ACXAE3_04810 [Candidatus Kariarchaeaceae archaeon]
MTFIGVLTYFSQLTDHDKFEQALMSLLKVCNPFQGLSGSLPAHYHNYEQLRLPMRIAISYYLRFLSDLVISFSDQKRYSGYSMSDDTQTTISDFKEVTRQIYRTYQPTFGVYYIYSFDEWIDNHVIQKIGLTKLSKRTTALTRLGHHFKHDSRMNLDRGISKIEIYFFTSDLRANCPATMYKIHDDDIIRSIEKLSNIFLKPVQETTETSTNGTYFDHLIRDHSLKAASFVAKMIEGHAPPTVVYNKMHI